MSRICYMCGKGPHVGNNVSKANNKVKRWIYPNVQKIRFTITGDCDNKVHNSRVCTKCMKANKVQKVF